MTKAERELLIRTNDALLALYAFVRDTNRSVEAKSAEILEPILRLRLEVERAAGEGDTSGVLSAEQIEAILATLHGHGKVVPLPKSADRR